jgi:acyl dehydratase
MLSAMGMEIGVVPTDSAAVFNYGMDKLRFLAPVKAGARVRCRAVLMEVTDQGGGRKLMKVQNTVEIDGEAKPALVAESLAMVVGRG